MKLDASIKRLLKNRIVLYVVFFFSVTNVLGYLTMKDYINEIDLQKI